MQYKTSYTQLSDFEKKALCAFGCPDEGTTIKHLEHVVKFSVRPESIIQLRLLISKLHRDIFPNHAYKQIYYNCTFAMDQENIQEAVAYQNTVGDLLTARPWKPYGKAELINEFCCNNPLASVGRLIVLEDAVVWPPFKEVLNEVIDELNDLYDEESWDFPEYAEWLNYYRAIVRMGEKQKEKGEHLFRLFKWLIIGVPALGQSEEDELEAEKAELDEVMPIVIKLINGNPGCLKKFLPEVHAEIEARIEADKASEHPSQDHSVPITFTKEQIQHLLQCLLKDAFAGDSEED